MSDVQPLTPYQPNLAVQLANQSSPNRPQHPTTPSVSATAPAQVVNQFNAVKQLPPQTVTAMLSQQAVNNGNLSESEKINKGILKGPAGVSLQQISQPGNAVKPGAGAFLQSLQQQVPTLNFNKVASNVLMTGSNGVGSPQNLVNNVAAQVSAVNNSIQKATSGLTNSGILNGKENATQVAGVVMAAATLGVGAVTSALKNPVAAISAVAGIGNELGKAITSGNFAAGLADSIGSGLTGIASSLSDIGKNALGGLSKGLTDIANKAVGGIKSLISGLGGVAQNAFNLAEKSFGQLKAGVPNFLGGLPNIEAPQNATVSLALDLTRAFDELSEAETELVQAKKAFKVEESAEVYDALKKAEARVSAASQKVNQIGNKVRSGGAGDALGLTSAQNLSTLASAAASGQLNTPTTENTGVNSLPGGIGAFANQLGLGQSNAVKSLQALGSQATALASNLANPAKLAGNIVNNLSQTLQSTVAGVAANVAGKINSVAGAIGGLQNAASNLLGSASTALGGAMAGIKGALGSLGNAPGQLKSAIMASDTFAKVKSAMTSTFSAGLDKGVPAPTFEEIIPKPKVNEYQQAQTDAQNNLTQLLSEREFKQYQLDLLSEEYQKNQSPVLLPEIESMQAEIATIDTQIIAAQEKYNSLIS
jgi:hypothetical protein